jgi:hypothetical protein
MGGWSLGDHNDNKEVHDTLLPRQIALHIAFALGSRNLSGSLPDHFFSSHREKLTPI